MRTKQPLLRKCAKKSGPWEAVLIVKENSPLRRTRGKSRFVRNPCGGAKGECGA